MCKAEICVNGKTFPTHVYLSARDKLHRTGHPLRLHSLVQNRYHVPLQAQAPMGLFANTCSAPTPLNFVSRVRGPSGVGV